MGKTQSVKAKTAVNYLLVDASGSMQSRVSAVREGLLSFCHKLRDDVPDSRLVIVFFGSQYVQQYAGPAGKADIPQYSANLGGTCLWGSYEKSLAALMAETADYKSLTLMSDGDDTGNQNWCAGASKAGVQQKVREARELGIQIGMVGTGMDAYGLASVLGIDGENVAEFKGDAKSTKAVLDNYGTAVSRASTGGKMGLTSLERASIDESPEDIAAREGEELITLNRAAKILSAMYKDDINQFFSVCFKKRTPPYKNRTYGKAQFHVTSKMKADGPGAAYDFLEKKLVPCWVHDKVEAGEEKGKVKVGDVKVGDVTGFRSIPLDGILALRCGGKKYRVQTGG